MKLGIKKLHENEWQVHIGNAMIRMDRFSLELLNIALEHLQALESGQVHSVLKSYVHLADHLMMLSPSDLQTLLRAIANEDVLILLLTANNPDLNEKVLSNTGGILAKQLQADLERTPMPNHDVAKAAIRRVIEKMYEFDGDGIIQVQTGEERYI
ncbi:MAG: hypothetical protein IE914_04350 [Thiotrichales bacterium]|nr:hypothetical protein [Thiotrichales bacterium]